MILTSISITRLVLKQKTENKRENIIIHNHVSVTKNKNLESENNPITIMNTFWSTELNFGLFLSREVSLCVPETK